MILRQVLRVARRWRSLSKWPVAVSEGRRWLRCPRARRGGRGSSSLATTAKRAGGNEGKRGNTVGNNSRRHHLFNKRVDGEHVCICRNSHVIVTRHVVALHFGGKCENTRALQVQEDTFCAVIIV